MHNEDTSLSIRNSKKNKHEKVPRKSYIQLQGWLWEGSFECCHLKADLLKGAGFKHGFFTRQSNTNILSKLASSLQEGTTVHRPKQIHSDTVLDASKASRPPWPEADGLVSDRKAQSLWVCSADCIPVLFADLETGHVAACHAGWKGLAKRILLQTIIKMKNHGSNLENLVVALGPAISKSNYEVGNEVIKGIAKSLAQNEKDFFFPNKQSLNSLAKRGILDYNQLNNKIHLDLTWTAKEQLLIAGLTKKQITTCPICTASTPKLFNSWRRDHVKAVQWSGIVSQPKG